MKIIIISGFVVVVLIFIALLGLSIASRKQPELGLLDRQLRPCPDTPNCVCSEYPGKESFIKPINYSIAHADAWSAVKAAVYKTGGTILQEQPYYLHASYVTPLMRFADDLELRQDEDSFQIHVRSASRVGHSDFGVNRRRVEGIRQAFEHSD